MRGIVWAVAGCALTLAACGGSPYTTATLTPSSSTTSSASTASSTSGQSAPAAATHRTVRWVDLQPGDCLVAPPPTDPSVVMVDLVDCAAPHQAEAFLRAPIPVNAALTDVGNQQCNAGLAAYTDGGQYTISYLIDSEQDRTSNNPYPSTVICLLQAPGGQSLTGSARH